MAPMAARRFHGLATDTRPLFAQPSKFAARTAFAFRKCEACEAQIKDFFVANLPQQDATLASLDERLKGSTVDTTSAEDKFPFLVQEQLAKLEREIRKQWN